MSNVKLVAVLSSYNRLPLLKEALLSLVRVLSQCPFQTAIVIFEAGSSDGSKEWLDEFDAQTSLITGAPQIEFISPTAGDDSSFSAGVNTSCRFAKEKHEPDYYLFFETDNWIRGPEPIEQALNLLERHSKLAAVGFTVLKHSGEPAGFGSSLPTFWQFILGRHLNCLFRFDSPSLTWQKNGNSLWSTCDVVFTSPIVLRRSAWDESGGFDQEMFPFSDCDADWSWRLADLGWQIAVLDTKAVVHDNNEQPSPWSNERDLLFHRARMRLLRRHLGNWVVFSKPLLFARHCLEYLLVGVLVIFNKRPRALMETRSQLIFSVFKNYSSPGS